MTRNSLLVGAMVAALALASVGTALAGSSNSANSLGKTTFDTEVSSWEVGDGQLNGEFVTAEMQGVVIGLRAQERTVGPIEVTADRGNRLGIYEAATSDAGENLATWNYDFHVDLSQARGNAQGRTLEDYQLVLEQDYTEQSLFGVLGHDPVHLPLAAEPFDGVCSSDTFDADSLCQQSWNPAFGNNDFDPATPATYNLRLVLTPQTFNGPPVAVAIQVNVTAPE